MKYIKIYNTRAEYNAAPKEDYDMSLIVEEDNYVVFYRLKYFNEQYFTIESLVDNNTISIYNITGGKGEKPPIPDLKYSLNNGDSWSSITLTSGGSTNITTILFKGSNAKLGIAWDAYNKFSASGNFKVYGNSFSLLYNDNFIDKTEFPSNSIYNLTGLFYGNTKLIDASNLILPALTCTQSCYNGMFRGCSNLSIAPQLPATISAQECYSSMFEGCINLLKAPEINLENLSSQCCKRMFLMDRNSMITTPKMTESPILRVNTGNTSCYEEMFKGNGNITKVTCLLTSLGNKSCDNWLLDCPNAGVFIKHPSMSWNRNVNGIPSGWEVQNYTEE